MEPTPNNQSPFLDELHQLFSDELKNRDLLSFAEATINRVKLEAQSRQDAYIKSIEEGSDSAETVSPLLWLKTEALAYITVLAMAHTKASLHYHSQGDHSKAHTWATDEGAIIAAMHIIGNIHVP